MEKIDIKELAKNLRKELTGAELFDPDELDKAIKLSKLDFTKQYAKPIPLIQMAEDDYKLKDVLTTSNISTTIGGAKSKKTFFATMIIASLLGYKDFAINGDLQGLNVILFDTEQSQYHVQKISNRLKTLLGNNLINIEIFALRSFTPDKRCAIIDRYLKLQQGKFSFVIIDGIVDLIYDFNDLRECSSIATKLMEWSANYNCHINNILHTNKDKNYARGHLGAELTNKSETVFRVQKEDDNCSIVSNEASRNEGFKEFAFSIEHGLPKRNSMPTNWYNNDPGTKRAPLNQFIDNSDGLSVINEEDIPF